MSRTPKSVALALVGLFLFAGFASAQDDVPSLPIHDTFEGDCPPVLDRPISLRDLDGLITRPEDMDLDGYENDRELEARSDPTWAESTPGDPDGDKANPDPCNHDPRIPGLTFELSVTCQDCEADAPIARGNNLTISVELRDGAGEPTTPDADGDITCTIHFDGEGAPADEEFVLTTADDVGHAGVYTRLRHISDGDFAGPWITQCSATVAGTLRETEDVEVDVVPTTFEIDISVGFNPKVFFEDEFIPIHATPSANGSFFGGDDEGGSALLHITTDLGVPLTSATGDEMQWNAADRRWTAMFSTDRLPDGSDVEGLFDEIEQALLDGNWTIEVDAEDDAPGEPNTGLHSTEVTVTSQPVYDLVINDPADAERGQELRYQATFEFRGALADHHNGTDLVVELTILNGAEVITKKNMTRATTNGTWTLTHPIAIGNSTGTWAAQARMNHNGTVVQSNEVKTKVVETTVDLFVNTDKASYRSPGAGRVPPSIDSADLAEDGGDAATGFSTAASAEVGNVADSADSNLVQALTGDPLTADPTAFVDDAMAAAGNIAAGGSALASDLQETADENVLEPSAGDEGDTIIVVAYPLGAEGVAYFNEKAGTVPGNATFTINFAGAVPSPTGGGLEPIEMEWVGPGDGLTVSHFRGEYALQTTDPPGDWTAVVSYTDDANVPNEGEGSDGFQIIAPADSPLPPTIEIEEINGIDVENGLPASVSNETWYIEGVYDTRSVPSQPTDVNQVWVRINGGSGVNAKRWVAATLKPGLEEGTGYWNARLSSQQFYQIGTSGQFDVQAVALVNPCQGQAVLCDLLGPNGAIGAAVVDNVGSLSHSAIYSETASSPVNFTFPQRVESRLLGVLGPDGFELLGNGSVLWNGTTHTLRGLIELYGSELSEAKIHIRRVAFDNCADLWPSPPPPGAHMATGVPGQDPDGEWCLRDRVTVYKNPLNAADIHNGFNLVDPPSWLADRVTLEETEDGNLSFDFVWDIRDSYKTTKSQAGCENAGMSVSHYVEDNSTLVRRSYTENNGTTAINSNDGPGRISGVGGGTCNRIPERIDDQGALQPWMKTVINPAKLAAEGLPGPHPHVRDARYWVWMTIQTTDGFRFDQSRPDTQEDTQANCAPVPTFPILPPPAQISNQLNAPCWTARANTEIPDPSAINEATGKLPGFDAVQLSFTKEYPNATITAFTRTVGEGESAETITSILGESAFRLQSAGSPLTFTGTIDPNGNSIREDSLKLVFYKVEFKNCIDDTTGEGNSPDLLLADSDGEWCVVDDDAVAITDAAFDAPFDGRADAPAQTFTVTWVPGAGKVTDGTWFATVSLKTADGDRMEFLPPIIDPRPIPSRFTNPAPASFDSTTFSWMATLEYLCRASTCHPDGSVSPKNQPFLAGQPGRLGRNFTGVSLFEATPVFTIDNFDGLSKIRQNAEGDVVTCELSAANETWSGCPETMSLHNKVFRAAVTGDEFSLHGNASDITALSDLETLTVDFNVIGYNLFGGNADDDLTLETIHHEMDLTTDLDGDINDDGAPDMFVERTLTTMPSGNVYLEGLEWAFHVPTTDLPETWGPTVDQTHRIIEARYGAGSLRNFLRVEVTVSMTSASGLVANPPKIIVQVDRLDAPVTQLINITQRTINPVTFAEENRTLDAADIAHMEGGVAVPNAYDISGNATLRFGTIYEDGLDLGNVEPGAGKLTGVDVSLSKLAPQEFFIFGPELYEAGFPETVEVGLPFPVEICQADPDAPAACNYEEPCDNGRPEWDGLPPCGTRVQNVSIMLVPVRIGVDPAFIVIDDSGNPANWFHPEKTTFGVDLNATGRIVEFPENDDQRENHNGDDYTGINWAQFAVSGNLSLENLRAGANAVADGQVEAGNRPWNLDPNAAFPRPQGAGWNEIGLDPSCGQFLANPASGSVEGCVPTYLPLEPSGDAAAFAGCMTSGDTAVLQNCFTTDEDDQVAQCIQDLNVAAASEACAFNAESDDELTDYTIYLVNRNTPLWIRAELRAPECKLQNDGSCWFKEYRTPDDPEEPDSDQEDFSIPRAFVWDRVPADDLTINMTSNGVEYDVNLLENVFASLDPASPDFGLLNLEDAAYVVTIRGVDNTESPSDVDDPRVANDAGNWQEFTFHVENDADDDGVSDLREDWLRARLQQNPNLPESLPAICEQFVYGPCVEGDDRYYDATTSYPNASVAASTESDWDGDGVPNLFSIAVPGVLPPLPGGIVIPTTIERDIEKLLRTDALEHDFPGSPHSCKQGVRGSGLLGDRDLDCRPNMVDETTIDRCNPPDDDRDGDGYCTSTEETAVPPSDPDDPSKTPADHDGDGIPDNVDEFVEFIERTVGSEIPEDSLCIQDVNGDCQGHMIMVTVALGGIEHLYVDQEDDTFSFGYHVQEEGGAPCPTPVTSGGHCELFSSAVLDEVVDQLGDADEDGSPNVQELQAGSNPFYKYSTPNDKGNGFPADWDADRYTEATASNPFQRCSIPSNPQGWSVTKPTSSCEDTNPAGGLNEE